MTIIEQISKPKFIASVVAELLGTFLLASVVIAGQGQPLALIFGLMAIVLTFGVISGAHVNPIITVGAWATKRIETIKAVGYILAQFLGAMLAFVTLKAFVDNAPAVSEEMMLYGKQAPALFSASPIPDGKQLLIIAAEMLGAIIFSFSVAHITSNKNHNSTAIALGVGGGLGLAVIIANSAAVAIGGGVILNPAVAVSLQAFPLSQIENNGLLWALAAYLGASIIGGIIGFVLSEFISKSEE